MPKIETKIGTAPVPLPDIGFKTIRPLREISGAVLAGIEGTTMRRWVQEARDFAARKLTVVLATIDVLYGGKWEHVLPHEALQKVEAFAVKNGHEMPGEDVAGRRRRGTVSRAYSAGLR